VCGRGPLNQTSKSNIFIFYSHTLPSPSPPPSSSPHETWAPGARRIQAALARSGAGRPPPPTATTPRRPTPSTLAPRASALAPQPSPAAKVAKSLPPDLAATSPATSPLAGDLPWPPPATSPPPHTPRTAEVGPGRAPSSSTTRRDGDERGGSRRGRAVADGKAQAPHPLYPLRSPWPARGG